MMRKQRLALSAIGLPLLLAATAAGAIMPASDEEMICSPTAMIEAVVTDARSADCRLGHPSGYQCDARNSVTLTLRIEALLPGSREPFTAGDTITVETRFCNLAPATYSNKQVDPCADRDRDLRVRGDGGIVSHEDVRQAFVGRTFIFTLWPGGMKADTWTQGDKAQRIWTETCPTSLYRRVPRPS